MEHVLVQDRAIIGQLTNLVHVRDPINNNIIASIRNPKVKISGYKDVSGGMIDMKQAIEDQTIPNFGMNDPPLKYE